MMPMRTVFPLTFVFSALALVACGSDPVDANDPLASSELLNSGGKGKNDGYHGDKPGGDKHADGKPCDDKGDHDGGLPPPPRCDLKCPDYLASTTVKVTGPTDEGTLDGQGKVRLLNSWKYKASGWASDVDIYKIIVHNGEYCFYDGPPAPAMKGITPWGPAPVPALAEEDLVTPSTPPPTPAGVELTFCYKPGKKGW